MGKISALILGATLLLLTGCKSIVKDYSVAELDSLDVVLAGTGEINGGDSLDYNEGLIWTCYRSAVALTVNVEGRKAKTKLEFAGKYFREEGVVSDRGTLLVTSPHRKNNLNLKIDLKRQQAKVNISNRSAIYGGCESDWFNLTVASE